MGEGLISSLQLCQLLVERLHFITLLFLRSSLRLEVLTEQIEADGWILFLGSLEKLLDVDLALIFLVEHISDELWLGKLVYKAEEGSEGGVEAVVKFRDHRFEAEFLISIWRSLSLGDRRKMVPLGFLERGINFFYEGGVDSFLESRFHLSGVQSGQLRGFRG